MDSSTSSILKNFTVWLETSTTAQYKRKKRRNIFSFIFVFCSIFMVAICWEGREKSLPSWLSQFSFVKLRQPTGQTFFFTFQRNFPISFKPKVAIAELFWKMQRKTWYSILGVDAMPLSLKNLLLSGLFVSKDNFLTCIRTRILTLYGLLQILLWFVT